MTQHALLFEDGTSSPRVYNLHVLNAGRWQTEGTCSAIKAPSRHLAGPAILMWQGSRDSIVDQSGHPDDRRELASQPAVGGD